VLDATLRANPGYSLLRLEHLSPDDLAQLGNLTEEDSFYGILTPRSEGDLTRKAVDQETALLFLTLQEPGPVPQYVRRKFGANCQEAITGLVLARVLEVRIGERWVSGPESSLAILPPVPVTATATCRIGSLSERALRYAEQLALDDVELLAARLYYFNKLPLTPAWRLQLPTPESTLEWLGLDNHGECGGLLARDWESSESDRSNAGWWLWRRRQRRAVRATRNGAHYKLYLSPLPEALPQVLRGVLEVFAPSGVLAFKIGKDANGVLRPDKMVAYLADFESLERLADQLQQNVRGCAAQGVPFTAPIDADGLFSWGMDPPAGAGPWAPDSERESWRQWITTQLARALIEARRAPETSGCAPREYALTRLQQTVDIATWTPKQGLWRAE